MSPKMCELCRAVAERMLDPLWMSECQALRRDLHVYPLAEFLHQAESRLRAWEKTGQTVYAAAAAQCGQNRRAT